MNREDMDSELDVWLNRAAAEYSKAEIRPGFETRIIAKLNGRPAKRRWHFRIIPITAAVAAILFLSIYLLRNQFQDRGTAEIASEQHSGSAAIPAADVHFAGKHARHLDSGQLNTPILESSTKQSEQRQVSPKARETKGGRFLSSGLSDQERYLIAFVRVKSEEASQDSPEKSIFNPLQIKEMQIHAFQIQSLEISSFEIDALPMTTPGSEEQL
jgi:hypothetical protein